MHCDTAALQKQVKLVSVQAAVQEVSTVSVGSKKRSLIPKDLCIHYDVDMLKILL